VHGLPSGGCGDSSAEREFPSDKVYRRDDHGIVGAESVTVQGLAFVVIHTLFDVPWCCTVPGLTGSVRRNAIHPPPQSSSHRFSA
jgi:hypothetical protein